MIQDEIQRGESRTLEYKAELPQDSQKWIKTIIYYILCWGSGFKRIFAQCEEYGVAKPEFLEIGDLLRVNFYRPSYNKIGDKSATNTKIGDKSAINYKEMIVDYLSKQSEVRSQDVALFIGLKVSRTKDYLAELVEEGKIVANGANKNRTYSLK